MGNIYLLSVLANPAISRLVKFASSSWISTSKSLFGTTISPCLIVGMFSSSCKCVAIGNGKFKCCSLFVS